MSTWKLYRSTHLLPEKNFCVDSLETYLSSFSTDNGDAVELTDMQYIKHSLSLSVKMDKSQSALVYSEANDYNYISIKNEEDSNPVYYFILSKRWKAKSTIELVLKMDTLNTFTLARSSFTISSRTLIDREHKNRLKRHVIYTPLTFSPTLPSYNKEYRISKNISTFAHFETAGNEIIIRKYSAGGKLMKEYRGYYIEFLNIDMLGNYLELYDEEQERIWRISSFALTSAYNQGIYYTMEVINTLVDYTGVVDWYDSIRTSYLKRIINLYSEGLQPPLYKEDLYEIEADGSDWYLIYKNQNDPDDSLLNPVDCFLCANTPIKVKGITNVYNVTPNDIADSHKRIYIEQAINPESKCFYSLDGSTYIPFPKYYWSVPLDFYFVKVGASFEVHYSYYNVNYDNFGNQNPMPVIQNVKAIKIVGGQKLYYTDNAIDYDTDVFGAGGIVQTYPYEDISTNDTYVTINAINSVDKTDPKIIKILKLPYCPTYYNTTDGSLGSGEWEYDNDTGMPKLSDLDASSSFIHTITLDNSIFDVFYIDDDVSAATLKDKSYESKLFHSDYCQPKFVYDSFSFPFYFERMEYNLDPEAKFHVNFLMTGTIHSNFLFEFEEYNCPTFASEDYYKVLNVAVNNEITIYNQQFINYLRAGFNYDVKAKTRTEVGSWVGTLLSAVGSIASFASSSATGAAGIAAGVGLAVSTLTGLSNSIIQTANAEANLEAKMAQLKQQSTSVSGSDDVDLRSYYTKNKAKMVLYKISPKMEDAMFDVFYYTGYISGERKVPDMTSRLWFNFVKCDIIFNTENNIPSECIEDLKELFSTGVFFMHKYNGEWNWDRDKENWEVSLFE